MIRAFSLWLLATSFVLFQFTYQLSSGSVVNALMDTFSLNASATGILISSYYYIYTLMQVPAGMLFDKFGAKKLLSIGALVSSVGCFLFASSDHFSVALAGRVLFGAGSSLAFVGLLYVTRMEFNLKSYAFYVGLAETLSLIGTVLGTIIIANIVKQYGWRSYFYAGSGFGLVIALLCYRFIHDEKKVPFKATDKLTQQFLFIVRNPSFWLNGTYAGLTFSIVTVFAALWSTPFLMTKLSISLTQASTLSGLTFLGAAIGCPAYGYVCTRVINRTNLLHLSTLGAAFLMFMLLYAPTQQHLFHGLLMFLIGLSGASYMVSFSICDELSSPHSRSLTAGFTNALAVIFAPLLQPLVGWLMDLTKSGDNFTLANFQLALSTIPVLLLVASFIAFYLPKQPAPVIGSLGEQPAN